MCLVCFWYFSVCGEARKNYNLFVYICASDYQLTFQLCSVFHIEAKCSSVYVFVVNI